MDKKYVLAAIPVMFMSTVCFGLLGWSVAGFSIADALYRSLLAFGGDGIYAPLTTEKLNPFLQVARFLGPATTILAIVSVLASVALRWLLFSLASFRVGHTVVIGDDSYAVSSARELSSSGSITIVSLSGIEPDEIDLAAREICLSLNSRNIRRLLTAIGRPNHILFATAQDTKNLELAQSVLCMRPHLVARASLRIESPIVLRELSLFAPELSQASVISSSEDIAAAVYNSVPLHAMARRRQLDTPHLLMFGLGRMGLALLREYAMRCHHPNLSPLRITAVDLDTSSAMKRLGSEAPQVFRQLEMEGRLTLLEEDGLNCAETNFCTQLEEIEEQLPVSLIIVSTGSETSDIGISMRLREIQKTRMTLRAPILMRSRSRASIGSDRPSDLTGGILRFGGSKKGSGEQLLARMRADMARALHDGWQDLAAKEGRRMPDWHKLSGPDRYTNERAVASTQDMLGCLGLCPDFTQGNVPLRLSPAAEPMIRNAMKASEALQRIEHARWSVERRLAGFESAPDGLRDNEMRRHPDLAPFQDLGPHTRAKDQHIIARCMAFVAAEGARPFVKGTAPMWRRRLRVGIAGPISPCADLLALLDTAAAALMERLPLEPLAFSMEVVTPNAPGFDRLAPIALQRIWRSRSGRTAGLMILEAMREDGLNRAALGMDPIQSVPAADIERWADFEDQTKRLTAAFPIRQVIDLRPLRCSDAQLLRNSDTLKARIRQQIAFLLDDVDVMIFGLNDVQTGGSFTRLALKRASTADLPHILAQPGGLRIGGDWNTLRTLPPLFQRE